MVSLPNNCTCSELSVYPKQWKKVSADSNQIWYISYRFYEPGKKPKQVMLKGMNLFHDLKTKQALTEKLFANELKQLQAGYNPNLKQQLQASVTEMFFIPALEFAAGKLKLERHTKEDIASVIKFINQATISLGYNYIPIAEVRRKHLRMILDKCTENKTANTFNNYRRYLSMLFRELLELEAIEFNPVRDISKRKTVKRIRQTLTLQERILVNDHLYKNYYEFWRFLQIFFHSGARLTELMKLQIKDVDLSNQRYKVTIRKGQHITEMWKIIVNDAFPLWVEQLRDGKQNEYVFSKGLLPGQKSIRTEQVTKRWKRLVKDKLNITADAYSLKHSKATMVSEQLGQEAAARLASHTTSKMISNVYDINSKVRQDEIIRNVKTPFVG